jgi:uncharacterized protein (TIGR02466 family)
MIDSKIYSLFPVPVYITKLTRKFTNKEYNFIQKSKLNVYNNAGNTTSNDSYILNTKPFVNLKKELNNIVKDYFDKVIMSSNNIEPYITQSWLNYTEQTQHHHIHDHPNSLVSGVLYINADKDKDNIKFWNKKDQNIKLECKEYNSYNSSSWWIPIETLDIILFPSTLIHSVDIKKGTNTRISLAFNVFVKGNIGSKTDLTELKLC